MVKYQEHAYLVLSATLRRDATGYGLRLDVAGYRSRHPGSIVRSCKQQTTARALQCRVVGVDEPGMGTFAGGSNQDGNCHTTRDVMTLDDTTQIRELKLVLPRVLIVDDDPLAAE